MQLTPLSRRRSSDSLDRLETSTLHAAGQVATFAKSRTGAFTLYVRSSEIHVLSADVGIVCSQGSQASIMMAAKNVPAVLATGSKNTLDAPLYANPRDVDEIPNLEILPMPYRFHSSMDDGKPDGLPRDLRKGKFDKSKGYFTVRPATNAMAYNVRPLTLASLVSRSFSSFGQSRPASSNSSRLIRGRCRNATLVSVSHYGQARTIRLPF